MDILTIFHVAISLGSKVLNAPPNYNEMLMQVIDDYYFRNGSLLHDAGLSKAELSQAILQPDSYEQKQWNNFINYFIKLSVIINELNEQINIILAEQKQTEKNIYAAEQLLKLILEARERWDMSMLNDEQDRMLKLFKDYEERFNTLKSNGSHITFIYTRLAEIQIEMNHHVEVVQNIAQQRMEKVTEAVTQSSHQRIDAFENLATNLQKVLDENTVNLRETETQLAKTDPSEQLYSELTSKVDFYKDAISKYEQAKQLIEQQKEKEIESRQLNEEILEKLTQQLPEPSTIEERMQIAQETLTSSAILIANDSKQRENTSIILNEIEELFKDNPLISNTLINNISDFKNGLVQSSALEDAFKFGEEELSSTLDSFGNLMKEKHSITQELKSLENESKKLHVDLRRLSRDINGYNRDHDLTPPPPPSNDSSPRP